MPQQAHAAAAGAQPHNLSKQHHQQWQQQQQQQQQHKTHHSTAQMHALHVDGLYPDHIKLLSEPFEVFRFDFARPPEENQGQQLQASCQCCHTA